MSEKVFVFGRAEQKSLAQKMKERLEYRATWAYVFDICIYVYIDIFCEIRVSRNGGNYKGRNL